MTRASRIAIGLWTAWAVVVWNVVFDHTIEVAGRKYVYAAGLAAQAGGPYARISDWMGPAASNGLWNASIAAGLILALGWGGLLCVSHLTR